VLFNEPKLLKCRANPQPSAAAAVSVLFNEPKLLKWRRAVVGFSACRVSVLFNEPKLLKCAGFVLCEHRLPRRFSALQRAEIAEIAA